MTLEEHLSDLEKQQAALRDQQNTIAGAIAMVQILLKERDSGAPILPPHEHPGPRSKRNHPPVNDRSTKP